MRIPLARRRPPVPAPPPWLRTAPAPLHRWRDLAYALGFVGIAVGLSLSLIVLPNLLPRSQASARKPVPAVAVSPGPPSPRTSAAPSPPSNPSTLTLNAADLPGFQQVKAGTATAGGPGLLAPSWDVVFQRGSTGTSAYRLTESIVVAYPSTSEAHVGLLQLVTTTGQAVTPLDAPLGDESTAWVEKVPNARGLSLVRVTFRQGAYVAQVAVLGPASSALQQEALALALTELQRLVAASQSG